MYAPLPVTVWQDLYGRCVCWRGQYGLPPTAFSCGWRRFETALITVMLILCGSFTAMLRVCSGATAGIGTTVDLAKEDFTLRAARVNAIATK